MTPRANCVADDWGLSPGVNEGILELCELGIVRSVSLFANLPATARRLDALLKIPGLRFSLHLNFTHGRPLSAPEEVASLCGRDGVFFRLPELLRRLACGRVDDADLALETARQLRRLKELGVSPSGVEGHHHVHLLPPVFRAIAPVLERERVAWLRLPADPGHPPSFALGLAFRIWSRLRAPRRPRLAPTLYLRPRDYASARRLGRKLRDPRGLPAIAHPAKLADLRDSPFYDAYQDGRVDEFRRLKEWSQAGA